MMSSLLAVVCAGGMGGANDVELVGLARVGGASVISQTYAATAQASHVSEPWLARVGGASVISQTSAAPYKASHHESEPWSVPSGVLVVEESYWASYGAISMAVSDGSAWTSTFMCTHRPSPRAPRTICFFRHKKQISCARALHLVGR